MRAPVVLVGVAMLGLSACATAHPPPPPVPLVITLAWDANDPAEQVTGYLVEYGVAPTFTTRVDVGNVTSTGLTLLPGRPYLLRVYAYNEAAGHQVSPPSVSLTVVP